MYRTAAAEGKTETVMDARTVMDAPEPSDSAAGTAEARAGRDGGAGMHSAHGVAPGDLRRMNEQVVLTEMAGARPWRVTDLMRATGLTRATVADVLRDLQQKEWVTAEANTGGGRGRPATVFRRHSPAGVVVGLDIGAHELRATVADLTGSIRARKHTRVPVKLPRTDRVARSVELMGTCLADCERPMTDVWSVHAGTTGRVSGGSVIESTAIRDWAGLDLGGMLRQRLALPVEVDNDIQLVGRDEQRWGAARDCDHALVLWLGRRPSVSLVLDGKPYLGVHGTAGDLSRVGLLPDKTWWSGVGTRQASMGCAEVDDPFATALAAADSGDESASAAIATWLEDLAPLVSVFTAVVDPEMIVLAGPLTSLSDIAVPVLETDLARQVPNPPRVAVSAAGDSVVADAAARRAGERIQERLLCDHGGGIAPLRRSTLVPPR